MVYLKSARHWLTTVFRLYGHTHEYGALDTAFKATEEGIRTVWIALGALALTSVTQIAERVESVLRSALPYLGEVAIHLDPAYQYEKLKFPIWIFCRRVIRSICRALRRWGRLIWSMTPRAMPPGVKSGRVFAIWRWRAAPPHRGTLLEPVSPAAIAADPDGYDHVIRELERGIRMVTGLEVIQSETPGWIGMACESQDMALWLLRAIIVENVSVRREDHILYFPAGPGFRLEKETKNIITVIAKTTHYWKEHQEAVG